jgi:hypothetical protein
MESALRERLATSQLHHEPGHNHWCDAAGVSKSAHGIRKAAATADAMDGYSDAELDAKFGWTGRKMAAHYTRTVNRERLSIAAARRMKSRT